MSYVANDPHSCCFVCHGQMYMRKLTCDSCIIWSEDHWKQNDEISIYAD